VIAAQACIVLLQKKFGAVTYSDIATATFGRYKPCVWCTFPGHASHAFATTIRWMGVVVDCLLVFMQFGFATVYMGECATMSPWTAEFELTSDILPQCT
jgi:hypothetical protein